MQSQPTPPKWPQRFIKWFCKNHLQESILGDLEEQFEEDVEAHGPGKARRKYARNVLRFFRPGIVRSLVGSYRMNPFDIFQSHVKTSLRSIRRNALFSSINVVGLAISMAVGILMIVFLSEIYTFDDFHDKKESIYRVNTTYTWDNPDQYASSSIYVGNQIQEQVPGVEHVTILGGMYADIGIEDKAIPVHGFFASSSFFDVFSFKKLAGSTKTALTKPNSIVLTESTARKLFDDENPIGKTIEVNRNSYLTSGIVTAVIADPPVNSHLRFEALVSIETFASHVQDNESDSWLDIWNNYVYVVLGNKTNADQVETTINRLLEDKNSNSKAKVTHHLQPLEDIIPSPDYNNHPGPSYSQNNVFMMISLVIIVLISACFNYTNLSLARSLGRVREVGIRKITGANRIQIFAQFTIEAVILSLVALLIGLGLFYLVKPAFLNLPNESDFGHLMFTLELEYNTLIYCILFAIAVGCLSGLIPSLLLSKLKPIVAFKDAAKGKIFSGIKMKAALIAFQFVLSIGLITGATIIYKQYQFALTYDLGYDTVDVVNIQIQGDYLNLLENEYKKLPEVLQTSRSAIVLGRGWNWGLQLVSDGGIDTFQTAFNKIDHNYLEMHGFELLAGTGFQAALGKNEEPKEIVINKKLVEEMNLGTVHDAIGKAVWNGENKLRIVGVVDNFVDASLHKPQKAFCFFQSYEANNLGVKLKGGDHFSQLERLEKIFTEIDPVHPFKAEFYNDLLKEPYRQYKASYTIVSFLAFLAISISALGLLGMAVFTTESRMKEISIRKVLGASVSGLMLLLSRSFMAILVFASIIAIPLTLYVVDDLVLSNFAYRVDIGLVELFSGFFIVLLIAAITIGWQIQGAASQNPADLLRDE